MVSSYNCLFHGESAMNSFRNLFVALSCASAVACGSGGGSDNARKPSNPSSSAAASSSSSEESLDLIEFIYPPFNADLIGTESTELIIKIKQNSEIVGDVIGVQVGDQVLESENGLWRTDGSTLNLASTTLKQSFDVFITDEAGTLESKALVLNTLNLSETSTSYVSGLGFDEDDETLFYTNAQLQALYKIDKYSYQSEEIFKTGNTQQFGSGNTYWSLAVDSIDNNVYIAADYLTGDSDTNRVELLSVTYDGVVTSYPSDNTLKSARSIVLDRTGEIGASLDSKAVYLLDYLATYSLQTWYLSGDFESLNEPTAGPTGNTDTEFYGQYGPKSSLVYGDSLLIARQYGSPNSQSLVGSITQVKFDNGPLGAISKFSKFSNFAASGFGKPMAMAFNRDKSAIYVADVGRVWELDITDESLDKTMRLISSSNIIPGRLGSGPSLGSSISEMALHPVYDILYVAAGEQGMLAINLATGNRSAISY